MRSSKKRKFLEPTRRLHVLLEEAVYNKLKRMAGPQSLGAFVDEMVKREYRRREKRMVQVPIISRQPDVTLQ